MKAALNGVINFSVLDGWFAEGYDGSNGWAIGSEKDYSDPIEQERADAASLYDALEKEIMPMYYQMHAMGDFSADWMAKMKASMRTLTPQFSARRMLKEYLQRMYLPVIQGEQ
jgi:starch phosphorylase